MAKYTEEEYLTKLLPESLAKMIIQENMKNSEYMDFLHNLWNDSREFLVEQRSEKEFLLSVMGQIDYLSNTSEYQNDLTAINKNAVTPNGKMKLANYNMQMYHNLHITRFYCFVKGKKSLAVKDIMQHLMYDFRPKLALWYFDVVCKNFKIEITQPVDLQTASPESIANVKTY